MSLPYSDNKASFHVGLKQALLMIKGVTAPHLVRLTTDNIKSFQAKIIQHADDISHTVTSPSPQPRPKTPNNCKKTGSAAERSS